ncbi:FAD-dependent oxidoreductase [Candidatus Dependentiae bacterium]
MRMFPRFTKFFCSLILVSLSSCIGGYPDSFNLNNALGKENLVYNLIIGSGPAGLNAAIYCARSGFRPLIVTGESLGGNLIMTTEIENVPGIDMITGPELADRIIKQAEKFGSEFLYDSVQKIDFSSWPYRVTTENGEMLHAMTVVVATGKSPRKLGVPGEDEYYGRGVSHCAICDGRFYKGKDVIVVGGGDSAVEEAIQLLNFGVRKVTVLVRKNKMRAIRCLQDRLKSEDDIDVVYNTSIKEIIGDGEDITKVKVVDNVSGKEYFIPASAIFLAIGSDPNTWFLKGQVDMNERNELIMKGRTQQTSVKALYAAGSIEQGAIDQIIIAEGKGRQAGIEAVKFLTEELGLDRKMMEKLKGNMFRAKDKKATPVKLGEIKTVAQFNKDVLQSKIPVLIDFYTEECLACKKLMPAVSEIAGEHAANLKVFKMDAGDTKFADILRTHKVVKVPRILLFKGGKVVEDSQIILKNRSDKNLSRKDISDMVERQK